MRVFPCARSPLPPLAPQSQSVETMGLRDCGAAWCVARPAAMPIPKDAPEGWTAMQVGFESEEQALFVVLGMGVRARVQEPRALLDRVAGEAMVVVEVAQLARDARDRNEDMLPRR